MTNEERRDAGLAYIADEGIYEDQKRWIDQILKESKKLLKSC